MIEVGQPFPQFSLQNESSSTIDNVSTSGKTCVFYFYPKDDTPGCTIEAKEFRELFDSFGEVLVFGVSPDSVKSHKKFIDKYVLPFSLLADTEHLLAESCGVWVEKSMYGHTYMGVERSTILVDGTGIVRQIWKKVKPEGHASDVHRACALG